MAKTPTRGRAVHSAGDDTTETLDEAQRAALEEAQRFAGARAQQPAFAGEAEADGDDGEYADPDEETFEEIGSARGPAHRTRAMDVAPEKPHELSSTPWVETANLAAPPARPGYVQRWIRIGLFTDPDAKNQSRKFRQGWRPRPADSCPSDFYAPAVTKGPWAGSIIVEGMLLCEMPVELYDRHKAVVRERTDRMVEGIDADLLKEQRPGMPFLKSHKTRVTTGRRPVVAPDA